METFDTLNRRSRFKPHRTEKRVELTDRDIAIFRLLDRYHYLRSTHLHALVGGKSHKHFVERLGDLYHEGRYLDRPAQQWHAINARYTAVVYELGEAGELALAERGLIDKASLERSAKGRQGAARQFRHELMICEIMASLEIGTCSAGNLRFIAASEILAKAPDVTRVSSNPLAVSVPLRYAVGGKTLQWDRPLVPDAIFGIEYSNEAQNVYRFFALEADCATEPISRTTLQQSSFLRKVLQYRELIAQRRYRLQWGVPNLFVLTVTTNETHLKNMMALLRQLTDDVGSTVFLFQSMSSICAGSTPYPAFVPWIRVGYDPLHIDAI